MCVHDGDDSEDDDGADDYAVSDDELEYIESETAGKLPPLSDQHLSYTHTHNSEVGGNLWYATGMLLVCSGTEELLLQIYAFHSIQSLSVSQSVRMSFTMATAIQEWEEEEARVEEEAMMEEKARMEDKARMEEKENDDIIADYQWTLDDKAWEEEQNVTKEYKKKKAMEEVEALLGADWEARMEDNAQHGDDLGEEVGENLEEEQKATKVMVMVMVMVVVIV